MRSQSVPRTCGNAILRVGIMTPLKDKIVKGANEEITPHDEMVVATVATKEGRVSRPGYVEEK